jgi:hypothetical protein
MPLRGPGPASKFKFKSCSFANCQPQCRSVAPGARAGPGLGQVSFQVVLPAGMGPVGRSVALDRGVPTAPTDHPTDRLSVTATKDVLIFGAAAQSTSSSIAYAPASSSATLSPSLSSLTSLSSELSSSSSHGHHHHQVGRILLTACQGRDNAHTRHGSHARKCEERSHCIHPNLGTPTPVGEKRWIQLE